MNAPEATIQIDREVRRSLPTGITELLATAVAATCRHLGQEEGLLTVRLTTDAEVHALNAAYRGENEPTDVLTFADIGDWPAGDVPAADRYLGDIVIAVPTALRQAATGGHSAAAELQLLTVHAVLHLLGHNHADEAGQAAMWAAQTAVLRAIGAEVDAPGPGHMAVH